MSATTTVRYKGHIITLVRTTFCGGPAWKYEQTIDGRLAGYGYHGGRYDEALAFARHQVDQRLAGGSAAEMELEGVN